MKILCICHSAILRINRVLFEHLADSGMEVHVIFPERWPSGGLGPEIIWESAKNKSIFLYPLKVKLSGNGSLHFYSSWFFNILKNIQPHYIFLDEEPWSVVALQTTLGIKFKIKTQPKLIFYTKQNLYKKYPFPLRWVQKYTFDFSHQALALSDECREVLIKQGYKKPITIFPHAVDLDIFNPHGTLEGELHEEGVVNIGFFGRLSPEKGGDDLILAFKKAYSSGLRVKLFFVGGGSSEKKWRNLAKSTHLEKAIHFLGPVRHELIPRYMKQMDIVCVPSKTTKTWKEQFGRVLIEGAACGSVLIGSNSGEIPNVMKVLGCSEQVFEEGNVDDLAQKIHRLVVNSEQRSKIAKEQLDNILKHYTYSSLGKKLVENFL